MIEEAHEHTLTPGDATRFEFRAIAPLPGTQNAVEMRNGELCLMSLTGGGGHHGEWIATMWYPMHRPEAAQLNEDGDWYWIASLSSFDDGILFSTTPQEAFDAALAAGVIVTLGVRP